MPLYDFFCKNCGHKEEMLMSASMVNCKYVCPHCNSNLLREISAPEVQTEHPSWLNDDVRNALQGEDEKPIETRSEYNDYLENRGIVPRG